MPVCALSLGETKVDKDSTRLRGIVEEIGRFDVAVNDAFLVYGCECSEQALEVTAHVGNAHVAVVIAEVAVLVVGQHSDDLVLVAEGGDERTY